MKKNSKIMNVLLPDNKIYLLIILFFNFTMLYYNVVIAVVGFIALVILTVYSILNNRDKMKKWTKYIENLSQELGNAAQSSLINLPVPLCLVNLEGKLVWYNSKFSDMLSEKNILDKEISKLIPQLSLENIISGDVESLEIKIGDKYFHLKKNVVNIDDKHKDDSVIIMFYWLEVTTYIKLKTKYNEERPILGIIQVDNYDEVIHNTKEEKIPFVLSEIESKINLWASRLNGMIKKYQKDKYMVIFENKYLINIESKRFTILDEIREIDMGNKISATLSIGIGVSGKNFNKLEEYSFSALELALARGGDQAVVRKNSNFDFYGGKTKAVEKRNRVKARVIAHALRPLLDESNEI
ncbi:MAG: phosphoesterase, partial [Clostridiales bacterium]|nr:phosphoesterase [Clostridiales bacterium]